MLNPQHLTIARPENRQSLPGYQLYFQIHLSGFRNNHAAESPHLDSWQTTSLYVIPVFHLSPLRSVLNVQGDRE